MNRAIHLAAVAAFLIGCDPEPVVPPQPIPGPGQFNPMVPPKPGSGGPQVGVGDGMGVRMNAQALAYYQQGMFAWSKGELAAAQTAFTQATQADAQAFQAYYSLGAVKERLGSTGSSSSGALADYQRAFEIEPKYDTAIVAYGLLMARNGNLSQAETFLRKERSKLSKSAAITAALAEVKSLQGDTAEAQELAQAALKINPSFAPAMMSIARDHYRNRRLDLALYALKAVLDGDGGDNPARDKDNAEGFLLRAFILSEQDNRVGAMENFRKALDLRPDLVEARIKLATYLLESGAATEALPMLQQAIKYDSKNIAAHLALGDAYRLTGKYKEAKDEFDWVKGQDSAMAEVHYNLGLLYLFAPKGAVAGLSEKKQAEAAIASFNKFKELHGDRADTDVEELLKQANLKKSEIEAMEAAKQPQPTPKPTAPKPTAPKPPTPKPPAPAPKKG